ncbi:MAG: discoidin domain-containing protein, partial [Bifidobacteriaceae bacterium]|nr:discoidin domain-containing protein [Bifidobacteriaceae bacterium]
MRPSTNRVSLTRRRPSIRVVAIGAALALAASLATGPGAITAAKAADPIPIPLDDAVAQTYHEVLTRHTVWVETQWSESLGYYREPANYYFSVVLGNALILTRGEYDETLAGVSYATLLDHTLRSIEHYAASHIVNRPVGSDWGSALFWNATYESYFTLGAHLLWDQLDQATRDNVDAISKARADKTYALGSANDSASGGWSPNGYNGGYYGDSKIEEMGVYALAFAPGLAWNGDDPNAADWETRMGVWMRNAMGLPVADKANPALLGGVPVSANTARNLWDTFLVENHETYSPHYQEEIWRTAARAIVHFLAAGEEPPETLTTLVNGEESLATILETMSNAGETFMAMTDDREHLFGRNLIPLAYLAQVQGNQYVARAEAAMAGQLRDYQEQANRCVACITQYNGEAKYEGEARAELAIAYLLHEWRDSSDEGSVPIATEAELFDHASRATDYGGGRPGLLQHQSPNAWAATVDRAGWTKFAWQPEHDDWLFDVGGTTPFFLPTANAGVTTRSAKAYREVSDGFDATASLLKTSGGYAGMTTLPTGSVVYATSGTAADEGRMSVWNYTKPMPLGTIPGLDGNRTYTTAEGSADLPLSWADPPLGTVTSTTAGLPTSYVARKDTIALPAGTEAQYVRMQGVRGHAQWYYSMWEFEVRNGSGGENLALAGTASASIENTNTNETADKAIDGSFQKVGTSGDARWGMPNPGRDHYHWWQVDLGQKTAFDEVTIYWESAVGQYYLIQVSDDGVNWRTIATRLESPADHSRIDYQTFAPRTAQYVRMQGTAAASSYGYSLWEMEVRNGAVGPNLAASGTAAASSSDDSGGKSVAAVRDENMATRWAVASGERARNDSWIQVDLGGPQEVDRVLLSWEAAGAAGVGYEIQTSLDGIEWTTVATYGASNRIVSTSPWLTVDNRAALVKRGPSGPININHAGNEDTIVLSKGTAATSAALVVEGYPLTDAARAAALAARPAATIDHPDLRISDADGYLSLFNLSDTAADAVAKVPQSGSSRTIYAGSQTLTADGLNLDVSVGAASSGVLGPRFELTFDSASDAVGVTARATSGRRVVLTGGAEDAAVHVASLPGGAAQRVALPARAQVTVDFDTARPYPLADLAVGRAAFPTSPLPTGMADPDFAVDDDPVTAWVPGSANGRMVVDLGAAQPVSLVRAIWGPEGTVPAATFGVSADGLTFTALGALADGRVSANAVTATARFVCVEVSDWDPAASANLVTLSVYGPSASSSQVQAELETDGLGIVDGIQLTSSTTSFAAGGTADLTVAAVDPYGRVAQAINPADVVFASSQPSDTIDEHGRLFAFAAGSRTIAATFGGASETVDVVVGAGPVTRLRVTATPSDIAAGETATLSAETVDAYGNRVVGVPPGTVAFGPLAPGESVAADGTWTALEAGERVLTGALGDLRGSAEVTVRPAPLDLSAPVVIAADAGPGPLAVQAGASIDFTAEGHDAHGNPIDASAGLTFAVSAGGVPVNDPARVEATGSQVVFKATGVYSVVATHAASGASTVVQVTVTPAALVAVDFAAIPPGGTVVAGGTVRLTAIGRDGLGNTIDALTGVVRTSSHSGDVVTGDAFTLTEAGARTLHVAARLTDGSEVSADFPVVVTAGPAASLKLATATQLPVVVGESIDLTATELDAYGNAVAAVTASAGFVSSRAAADVFDTAVPGRVTVGDAGVRVFSATHGALVSNDLRVVATSDAPVALVAPSIAPAAPRLGQTVNADPGTWSPAATQLAYQWLRDGATPIAGATSAAYQVQGADVGHTLVVHVTAEVTGHLAAGAIVSAPTVPVGKAVAQVAIDPPAPVLAGAVALLTVRVTGSPVPATGTVNVTVAGQEVSGAVSDGVATVPLSSLPTGTHPIRATYSGDGTLEAATTASATLTVLPGRPVHAVLSGDGAGAAVAGESLQLEVSATDAFGNDLGDVTATCVFESSRSAVDVFDPAVPGRMSIGDAGVRTIVATCGALTSNALRVVASSDAPQAVVVASVAPAAPTLGQTLTASPGVWSPAPTSVSYQWLRDGASAIAGATSAAYTPRPQDVGHTLAVRVAARTAGYLGTGNVTSSPTAPVGKAPVTIGVSVAEATAIEGGTATVAVAVSVPAGVPEAAGQVTVTVGGATAVGTLKDGR